MEILSIIGLGIPLAICVYCSFIESKVISPYKEYHVFGRVKAYLAMDFTLAGFLLYLGSTITPLFPNIKIMDNMGFAGVFLSTAVFGAGLIMLYTTYLKCPDELKKRVILDMFIVGFGVTMKICLFFLPFIWKVATYAGPRLESPVPSQEKKDVRVWKEDFYGNRTYYKVSRDGERYLDDDGEWKRIKGR